MSYPDAHYSGDGEASATVRLGTAPPELDRPANTGSYLATGASTGGKFGLYRWDFKGPATGPGPHFHRTLSESFFVLSGTIQLYDGKKWRNGEPGDFLYVPEGGIHGFRNESGEPASMLILFAPGAPREDYFEGVAAAAQMPEDERAEFYLRHDQYWV
ncbi:cupin domain-containing protein [Actinoplanes sp. TFC3]|uniref:cupin domain-containing protein n=1 Tax=Actinoplanes sp. TFC3 TaxID=1710355 RepID=UPI000830047C|nr:cupin domain-containing protein [Actinoplanes sp. TFC3]